MTQPVDHAIIERRWLQMLRDDPFMALYSVKLCNIVDIYKAWLNNNDSVVQQRIDEEGCGVIFAAIGAI